MSVRLADLQDCFQGVVPSVIATASRDGEPNVTYLSHVQYVDERHIALSCQFFNKTTRNVRENPLVALVLYDPIGFDAWRIRARYVRSETAGALFDTMSARIQVIASHTGMAGVFRLLSSDVYEVLSVEPVEGFLLPPDPALDALPSPAVGSGPLTELRGLQVVSERIARASDVQELMDGALVALDELLGFSHAMILLATPDGARLVVAASRGYGAAARGLEVCAGAGLIGTVAASGRMVRMTGVGEELRYGRAVRRRVAESGRDAALAPEVPLLGLADAQAQLGLPLQVGGRSIGVLAVESRDPLCFDEWDEAYLQIVANQIALGIDRMQPAAGAPSVPAAPDSSGAPRPVRRFVYYRNDDCVFVDGEYLVRNLPGRILWKLLGLNGAARRTEFTNRELRLDPALGLPRVKDNLESRLILLRKRLEERCPEVRMVPVRRGRFALEVDCETRLEERETA